MIILQSSVTTGVYEICVGAIVNYTIDTAAITSGYGNIGKRFAAYGAL